MVNRTRFALGVLCCGMVLLGAAEGQQEQWLQYRSAREVANAGHIQVDVSSENPAELPGQFKFESVCFGKWSTPMLESGYLLMAFGSSRKNLMYDRLLIDSDADGSLTDEEVVESYRMDQSRMYFGPVKVVFEVEDGPVTYHLNLQFHGGEGRRILYVSAGGWYEGDITVGGVKKRCKLLDYNVNGAFNDKSAQAENCDRIEIGEDGLDSARFVGHYVEVGGEYYRLEVVPDGAFITLGKADDLKLGKIKMPETIAEFSAGGVNGLFTIEPEGGVCSLPVGTYSVHRWVVSRADENGDRWELRGEPSGKSPVFDVSEDGQLELSIGEPIMATLKASRDKSAYSFDLSMKGSNGERLELTRNGSQPQAPKLNVKSEDGTYDRIYSFAYG